VGEFKAEVAELLRSGWPGRIAALAEAIEGGGDG